MEITIGDFLKRKLEQLKITQSSFARQAGLSLSPLSKWINNQGRPDLESCLKIAAFLGEDPVRIFKIIGRRDLEGLYSKFARSEQKPRISEKDLYKNERHAQLHVGLEDFLDKGSESPDAIQFVKKLLDMTLSALKESEERHRALLEHLPEGILVHQDGKIAYCNPAAVKILGGHAKGDLLQRSTLDFVPKKERPRRRVRIHEVQAEGRTFRSKRERVLRLDGQPIWVQVTASPVPYRGRIASQVIFRPTE